MRTILAPIISLTAAAFLASSLIAADVINDVPVELSRLTVTAERELPPPESWRYGESQRFVVLSDTPPATTQRLVRDLELFEMAIATIWPSLQIPARRPTTLVFSRHSSTYDSFKPVRPANDEGGGASLLFPDPEQPTIVIDLATKTIELPTIDFTPYADGATPSTQSEFEVDHYRQLYREYARFLFSRATPRLPPWFEEGMAQLVMSMEFNRHRVVFGKIDDSRSGASVLMGEAAGNAGAFDQQPQNDDPIPLEGEAPVTDSSFNIALRRHALIPLEKIFSVTRDSPIAQNPIGNAWAKQSSAFVHLCLYGRGERYQKQFLTFVQRCVREPVSETMFKECFGKTYGKMLDELGSYIEFTEYDFKQFNIKGDGFPEPTPLVLREATQAEIGHIKGETLRAAGKIEAARKEMTIAYQRGERDPRLLASLGLIKAQLGEKDDAAKLLETATAAKVARFRAYIELAHLNFDAARAKPASADGKFSATQVASVLRPLFAVRAQKIVSPELYELIADTWEASATPPVHDNLGALTEGVKQFPRQTALVLKAAELFAKHGFKNEAREFVALGLKVATDGPTRERFAKLQGTLAPASAN